MFSSTHIYLFLLALFAIPVCGHTQRIYMDEALHPVEQGNAVFYAEVVGKDSGCVQAKITDLEGGVKAIGNFKQADLLTPDGPFIFYYSNGTIESQGAYVSGRKDGIWLRYDSNGEPLAEKIYDSSLLDDLIFTQAQQMPSCPGGQRAWVKYVQAKVGKLKGHPTALFIVEKDGTLSEIKVLGAESEEVSAQVLALIASGPVWTCGLEYGQPVRVKMRVPLR